MHELHFHVATPHRKPLEVIFRKNGENLTALCSCPQGEADLCQHQLNILCGSTEGILNARNEDVKLVTSWIDGTDVGRALHAVLQATTHLQNARDDFDSARQRLIQAMQD